ncbi:MAG: DUF2889 domain-containing protein [Burkholderiales bacterium]
MPMPPAAPRRPLHTRTVVTRGFLRDDGMWDIEGELLDVKEYVYEDRERGAMPPGQPEHLMRVRLTLDQAMVVRACYIDMAEIPFDYCAGAANGQDRLVGVTLGAGWRQAVGVAMKGIKGCTHVREVLLAMATTAFQTVSAYREQFEPESGMPQGTNGELPFFLNGCRSWDVAGPVVAKFFPEYARKKAP